MMATSSAKQSGKVIGRRRISLRSMLIYLTEARRLFDAHDRTELVVRAALAGEIGLDELSSRRFHSNSLK